MRYEQLFPAAEPPSYDSLFGRIRDTHKTSRNFVDFLVKVMPNWDTIATLWINSYYDVPLKCAPSSRPFGRRIFHIQRRYAGFVRAPLQCAF